MSLLKIEIYTKRERNQAISDLVDAVNSSDGWVSGHQLFSNVAASIAFEIPYEGLTNFLSKLEGCDFTPHVAEAPLPKGKEIKGTIAITFIHEEPDMKRDVPAFG